MAMTFSRMYVGGGLAVVGLTLAVAALAPACSLSDGQGDISGTLNVPDCWTGKFDLRPDFFAGVPYRDTMQLRIQSGGDYETFSDGVLISIDSVSQIRPSATNSSGLYGVPLLVSLPPGVTAPGVPIVAVASPSSVHMALYLQRTCQTETVALYALDRVTVNADGTCDPVDGSAEQALSCDNIQPAPGYSLDGSVIDSSVDATVADADTSDAGTSADQNVRGSTITFTSLFDLNPDENVAAQRLNQGTFDVYLADPRDICPGGLGPPPRCRGHLTGNFKFYFERGRPAQPFP